MNGKQWEKCIQQSCERRMIFCKKLADGTSCWSRQDVKVRFQKSNECDFIIHYNGILLMLEAKSHKGTSLPLDCIRDSQIKGLTERALLRDILCGFLVLFSDYEEAYFITIQDFLNFERVNDRKSIPISFFRKNYKPIGMKKKKVNYDINIEEIFNTKITKEE